MGWFVLCRPWRSAVELLAFNVAGGERDGLQASQKSSRRVPCPGQLDGVDELEKWCVRLLYCVERLVVRKRQRDCV